MNRGISETGRKIDEEKKVREKEEEKDREKEHNDRGGRLSVFKPSAI